MHSPSLVKLCYWQVAVLSLCFGLFTSSLWADSSAPDAVEAPAAKPLSESQAQELVSMWEEINANRSDLDELEARVGDAETIMAEVLGRRTDQLWEETMNLSLSYCNQVADLSEEGYGLPMHEANALQLLGEIPLGIKSALDRIRERVVMPDFDKPALEQVAIDRDLSEAGELNHRINRSLFETCRVAERYEIDLSAFLVEAKERIESSAVNTSVYLDLSLAEVNDLRASLTVMPDDAELKAKLRVAEIRVREVISILTDSVDLLTELGVSTTQYRRQLLAATGALTAVSLDVNVISNVLKDWWYRSWHIVRSKGPSFLFQALFFSIIIYFFYKLANLVRRLVQSALRARHVRLSLLMQQMIASVARGIIIGLGILVALSQFNVSIGPMLAGLGIVGFIVGFALQDSLSNFASGLMILFYEPFDVGDTVIAGGVRGRVSSMSLVNTTIRTFDNQSLIIPNNKIWQDVITNITDQHIRRIDMEFGVSYGDDLDKVEDILHGLLKADERVLKDPEAKVLVDSFGDSSVNILCRPWVNTEDYWEVRWDFNKRVKKAFDREGVVIPFPQRDVHLYTQAPSEPEAPKADQ
ncbi:MULTISPECIES: mechanosensitive ion channel family protein [unclassified Lentimonas]|uniref:mechanosensitive ion channel family protein n=1 Tax=unclassified Lentimonas TaxID=2630993 RepID=UPI001320A3F8|nr:MULTISPECIES: mechanosensitive ion channel family protein [unclassified Lentimonas]CAA6690792.1 Small-conductance mechanosensitive channel [Lentimonas sp. CC19]CAA6693293.1 Small-conductance mechanosensitive channel [Lentimonas sp. CC10]CAA7071781.1 Small-conductance mechanosensitive channel [Lentimonas sp. CC11]